MAFVARYTWSNSFASSGDHTFTADLGGKTPKAAAFWVFGTNADGSPSIHALMSMGVATAVGEQWCIAWRSRSGVTPSSTGRLAMTDECMATLWPGSSAIDGEATFKEFVANGVTVTTGNAWSDNFYVLVLLLAGDIEVYADNYTLAYTEDNSVDITDPGFEFDFMLTSGHAQPINDTGYTTMFATMGLVLNLASGLEQYSLCYSAYNGQAAAAIYTVLSTNYGWGITTSGGIALAAEYSDIDSNGFTSTTRINDASDSEAVCYLAVKLNGVSFDGGIIDLPTSTGDYVENDPGFKPQAVLQFLSQLPGVDTLYSNNDAGACGFSMIDKDNQYCGAVADEDNSNPTDTQNLVDNKAILFALDNGATGHEADFLGLVNTGWKLDFTITQGIAKKAIYLALGEAGVGRLVNPKTHLNALVGGKLV